MTLAKDVATPLARKHGLLKLWEVLESSNLTLTRPDITHAVTLVHQRNSTLCTYNYFTITMLYGYSNADREVVSQLGDQLQVITSKKQTTVD
uniref:Uncharacterized protein n=1 Tax=Solanum lycopersicum TaxID=4081 RepID=A0A3Q7GF40_SOLLC